MDTIPNKFNRDIFLSQCTDGIHHEIFEFGYELSKEEIENFVMVGGEKKTKTEEEIATSVNRGTNAFKNATNFLNTIKSEQSDESLSSKKVSKKK